MLAPLSPQAVAPVNELLCTKQREAGVAVFVNWAEENRVDTSYWCWANISGPGERGRRQHAAALQALTPPPPHWSLAATRGNVSECETVLRKVENVQRPSFVSTCEACAHRNTPVEGEASWTLRPPSEDLTVQFTQITKKTHSLTLSGAAEPCTLWYLVRIVSNIMQTQSNAKTLFPILSKLSSGLFLW